LFLKKGKAKHAIRQFITPKDYYLDFVRRSRLDAYRAPVFPAKNILVSSFRVPIHYVRVQLRLSLLDDKIYK
jgi:hypothetical protein